MAKLQADGTIKYSSHQEAYETYNFHRPDQLEKLKSTLQESSSARSKIISLSGPEGIGKEYLLHAAAHNLTRSGSPTAVAVIDLQDWNADAGAYLGRLRERLSRRFGDSIHDLLSVIQPQVAIDQMVSATEIAVTSYVALSLEPVGNLVKLLTTRLRGKSVVQRRSDWEHLRWIIAEATRTHTTILYFPGAHHDHYPVQQACLDELRSYPRLVVAFGNQEDESSFSLENLDCQYNRFAPLEIALRPLSRVESHEALANKHPLRDLSSDIFEAIHDVSQGFPSRMALALAELDEARLIYPDERGVWQQSDDAKSSAHLAEILTKLRFSRPVDVLLKTLAERKEFQQREHLQNFLLAASVCSPYVPFDWIIQALEIPAAEADRLLDLLTDELLYEDGLPVLEYLAHQIVELLDTETFRFQNPLLADVLRIEDPKRAQQFADKCFKYHRSQPHRNRTVLAQLSSLAEHAGVAKSSEAVQLRAELRWWVEAELADQLRALLIESCNNGSCEPEVLWLAATGPARSSLPGWRRHMLLEAYGMRKHGISYERYPLWLSHLAACLFSMSSKGHVEEGLKRYYELLSLYQNSEPPNDVDIATAREGVGNCLHALGKYDAALKEHRLALALRESALGPGHPLTLISVSNLATILVSKGDYEAAEPLHRRSLEAHERVLGPEHPDTLITVVNLASLLSLKGDDEAAEPLHRRSLEARERVLGPEQPKTLTSVRNLAYALKIKGDYEAAEQLYRRSLEGHERVLGPEHPDTLITVGHLALLLSRKGDHEDAEQLYRRKLEACERVLGPEHPDTLESVYHLAYGLASKGDYEVAEQLYRRSLEARERVLGPEHPCTLNNVYRLAGVLESKGDYEAAEPLYCRTLERKERAGQAEHPLFAMDLNCYALLLRKLRRYEEAAAHLERAIELGKRFFSAEHPIQSHFRNNRAIALMLAVQLDEAIQQNAEAWSLKAHISEGGHDVTSGRILFLRIVMSWLSGSDAADYLGQLRTLFEQPELPCREDIDRHWQAADILDHLRQRLSPDQADLLTALVEVLNDLTMVSELDRFLVWTGQAAVRLDVAWPNLSNEGG